MTPAVTTAGSPLHSRKPLTGKAQAAVAAPDAWDGQLAQEFWPLLDPIGQVFIAAPATLELLQDGANDNSLEEFHAAFASDPFAKWPFQAKLYRPKVIFSCHSPDTQPQSPVAYSDEELESMAEQDPVRLAQLMRDSKMTPWEATFGAEYLGRHCAETVYADLAVATLIELLSRDPSALREGAVYGLRYLACEKSDAALQARYAVETVEGVRAAIAESLGW